MRTRLAEADPAQQDEPHSERATDEVVQGDSARRDVAPRVDRVHLHAIIAPQGLDGLRLDQGDLPAAPPAGKGSRAQKVAIPLEPPPGDRAGLADRAHDRATGGGDVN